MPRFLILAFFNILFFSVFAQVYHYETGKVVCGKPGQIIWTQGVYENYPAEYGTFITNENPSDSKSKELLVPLIRIKSIRKDSVHEPIFLLHGGPGEKNIQNTLLFPHLLNNHDLIFVGYRGVEGSVKLITPVYKQVLFAEDLSFENYQSEFSAAFIETMHQIVANSIQPNNFNMKHIVADIEQIRSIENYDSLSLLSFSFGTMLAQLYACNYSQYIVKNIQIGARPLGDFTIDNTIFTKQLKAFCANRDVLAEDSINSFELIQTQLSTILQKKAKYKYTLNPIRFSIFFYSQFYTYNQAYEMIDAMILSTQNNWDKLSALYHNFYEFYPNIMLADLLIKKQGYYNTENENKETNAIDSIIKVVNNWYAPENEYFKNISHTHENIFHGDPYFIVGAIDVATPSFIQNDSLLLQKTIIPNSGHLDMFLTEKKQLQAVLDSLFTR
jgi:pimeloyl-ACP methyl ester carboxylesterase